MSTNNTTKKVTKAMRTNDIIAYLRGEAPANGLSVEEMISYLEHELELINKKSKSGSGNRKPTATQVHNEEYKTQILAFLNEQEAPVSAFDVAANVEITVQRAAALLTALAKMGAVTKSKEKGKNWYKIAE